MIKKNIISRKFIIDFLLLILLSIFILIITNSGRANMAWASEAHPEHHVEEVQHNIHSEHNTPVQHETDAHLVPLLTPQQSSLAYLPFWAVFIPLLGAFGALVIGDKDGMRNILVVGTTVASLCLLLAMYGPVVEGININGQLYRGINCQFHFLPGFNFSFRVDPAGLLVAAITAFLWVLSSIYAISYMTIEENRVRYDFCVLATLTADLGVLLAGDFMTLFILFEGLIIFPYALVAHKGTKECLRGANMYLYLGVVTGLSLLAGIILLYAHTGSVAIQPITQNISRSTKYLISALMIIGFGGKAGLFFEHIWLPNAHPVAPTPASTLLSGAMIKAGAYGIFRVVNMLWLPARGAKALMQWATMSNIGYVVIWIGTVTMFLAVLSALITANSKRMLAFHSVSQMGYIVLGIGCAAYMGTDGAMGLAGSLYHIVNHALFKASLFLCVGAVYFRTHELDMYKLGGLWRNMPVIAVGLLIAVCGISGIPGFNGFASKTLLHHAILEAYDHSAHLMAGGEKDFKLKIAEIIFMLTAGGTFASNIKLFMLTFMGKRREKHAQVKAAPLSMKISIGMVSFAILYIGLFPNWLLDTFIGPALGYFGFAPASHAYHLLYNVHSAVPHSTIPILYTVGHGGGIGDVVHNLLGGGMAVMLGGMYFIPGMRFGLFHFEVPKKLQLEYYYIRIFRGFKWLCIHPISAVAAIMDQFIPALLTDIWLPLTNPISKFSAWVDQLISSLLTDIWFPLSKPISKLSEAFNLSVERILPIKIKIKTSSDNSGSKIAIQEEAPFAPFQTVEGSSGSAAAAAPALQPVAENLSPPVSETKFSFKFERPHPKNERPWQLITARGYLLFSGIAAKFDFKVIDGIVNLIGRLTHAASRVSSFCDTRIIEGVVNGTAHIVDSSSNLIKRVQTGRIQNYLLAILLGMLVILNLYLFKVLI